ncbi:hypothetical protein RJ639_015527 [Escallonia herrerae]|uniref:CCT domain-containing protein n=1 Tax=Escallonia herrerae TaxID=1293975 RepID=A0AA88VFD0_9ASTE|nr:hypothetical protein RJ639_015527 [Escallonia herrerae]
MYGYTSNCSSSTSSNEVSYADFLCHFPLPEVELAPLPPPLVIPFNEFDSLLAMKADAGYGTPSSNCSSFGSPSSLASYGTQSPGLMQRSVSSHSLQKNVINRFHQLVSSPTEFLDSETSSVRRVFSTGDLEGVNMVQHTHHRSESPLSNESSSIIEGLSSKACRYSPEEKKERIEKYRSKRNQRNFNKKIKYACRKTLADSRPRIRGRFARNDEIEKASQNKWTHAGGDEDYEEDDNWTNILEALSANLNFP